jgi:FecR protein/SPOR domain
MHTRSVYVALLIATTLCALPAVAAPPSATVEGVQTPVLLVRDGRLYPLNVGMNLKDNDQIRTGVNSKVLLRFSEGSVAKLGENATFNIVTLQQDPKAKKFFNATLNVLKGAFRFTTQAVSKFKGSRDIKVRFHTVTAGIRGTDIWGKVAPDSDLVALIEGEIEVTRGDEAPITMEAPRTFYLIPKDAEPLAVQPIPAGQLEKWALETEIAEGEGAIRRGGKWKINILEADNQKDALEVYVTLEDGGYPAEIKPIMKGEAWSYRVRIANLPSKMEAEALAEKLKNEFKFTQITVSK